MGPDGYEQRTAFYESLECCDHGIGFDEDCEHCEAEDWKEKEEEISEEDFTDAELLTALDDLIDWENP